MEPPFRRIAIIGLGLIGGSMALGWRRTGVVDQIIGWDRDSDTVAKALEIGAIDRIAADPAEAVIGAGVVVLAVPVGAIIDLAPVLGPRVGQGTLVTDTGSSKAEVVRAWEAHLAEGACFVGGHPMAGSEKSGVEWADACLFRGAQYLLTPGQRATDRALRQAAMLGEALGCRITVLSAEDHDRRVALVSHLPQLAAVALCTVLGGNAAGGQHGSGALRLAGGGFRDTTRIAASSPELWGDILLSNREAIVEALQGFLGELETMKDALARGDRGTLVRLFNLARETRSGLTSGQ